MSWVKRVDEYGEWLVFGNVEKLIKPSQKWYDDNPSIEPEPPEPTPLEMMTDYLVDVDYRLTLVELGLV